MESAQLQLLKKIVQDVGLIREEIVEIKEEISDLRDLEANVKPEYAEKLQKIEKGKFLSREEFEKEMSD